MEDELLVRRQTKRIRKSNMEWSLDSTLTLIRKIKSFENLWNPNCINYKKRESTRKSWEAISKSLKVPKHEAVFRWAAIRGNYHTHLRKESELGGLTAKKMKHPNPLYTELIFLNPILKNDSKSKEMSIDTKNLNEDSISIMDKEIEETASATEIRKHESPMLSATIPEMQSNPLNGTTIWQDDAQIFGDFIASTIRELPSKEKQQELKRIINRTVIDFQDANFPINNT